MPDVSDMTERRPYRSPTRDEQARATRHRIGLAAAELFVRDGYAPTTVADVARHGGVSAQTVYNVFGTKAALLKAAYDMLLVGDAEDVPPARRPHVQAMYALTDAAVFLRSYARLGRSVLDRVGQLMLQIAAGAAAGEPDLVVHRQKTDAERLVGTLMVARRVEELGALRQELTPEAARDRIWTLNSVEVWHLLTGTRGWSAEAYEDWIGEAMCAAVIGPVVGPLQREFVRGLEGSGWDGDREQLRSGEVEPL
jgi:AcrR family transcriptional regulator